MTSRAAVIADAERFVDHLRRVDQETQFLLFTADSRGYDVEQHQRFLEKMDQDSTLLVAVDRDRIIGHLLLRMPFPGKARHTANLVIAVENAYQGRGVAVALMEQGLAWANDRNAHRIELTVMEANRRAIRFYEKLGFQIEGVRKQSILQNGEFVNELYMGLIL